MKKITVKLISLLLIVTLFSFNYSYAQIGNLKGLKDKASSLKKDKSKNNDAESDDNSSSKTYTVNAYGKYMDEGYKFKSEKNFLEALTSFSNALKEKPGDYSAKQQVSEAESAVKDFYMDKIAKEIEANNCEQAEKDLNAVVEVLGVWRQADYYNREIAKCKESAGANAVASDHKAKIDALTNGSGNFYSDFAKKDINSSFSVGQDLFVKFKFEKTMMEYSSEFGIDETFNAYGFFTIYMNGKKVVTDGPYHFSSNYSKVWTDFDVPLSVSPQFLKQLQSNPALLATNQDIWLLQQVSNPTGIATKYIMAAIQNMKEGNHTVKVEFGLGEKSDKEPKGTVATGEVKISVDADSKKELYKRGPKYLRPLDENEEGKFVFNSDSYELGNGNLSITLDMPQAPKYYNMKWCQSMSCDYDHGELMFVAELDGKYLASWQTTFWDADYETIKSFSSIIFPANDHNLNNDLSDYNSSPFFKKVGNDNPVVYALYDLLYANKLLPGTHTLTFKAVSPEAIPPNTTYEASKEYYDKLSNSIAKHTVTFNVGSTTRSKLIASSSAKRLSHAGGSWASIDAHLKASSTNQLATILDVATYTEWKVTVNSLGTPLFRICKANVLYKSKEGAVRFIRAVEIKADYNGGNSYSKPYFNDRMHQYYSASPGSLYSMHYPVPASKIK